MITTTDYTFAESEADDHWAVRLLTDYAGVIYMYGEIKVRERVDDATLDFKYKIIDPGQFKAEDLENDIEFKNHLGAVLQHIIEDAFENGKAKINDRSKHTTNNNPESPLQ